MITANAYQDTQIMQGTNFENVVLFDSTHTMVSTMSYAAIISLDKERTSFTGPNKTTGDNGTYASNDVWASGSVTGVYCNVIADRSANTVTITLPAVATKLFGDTFEGYWDLVEYDSSGTKEYTRQLEGDVVVSPGIVQIGDTFTISVA